MLTIFLSIFLVLITGFYFLKSHYDYWKKRGVPGPKPIFLVGNMGASFTLKKSTFDIFAEIYNKYKHFPFVGIFKTTVPTLLICHPDVIKDMTIKSFNNFHDNDIDVDKKHDPIFGRNPFVLKGEEWKVVRSQLTPGFTSGKLKWIYPHLENTSEEIVDFIKREPDCTNGKGYNSKELCSKFTLDNVAKCAFGIEAQAFKETESEFKIIAKSFFEDSVFQFVLFTVALFVPVVAKIFRLKFLKESTEKRLTQLVSKTLKYREDNNIVRNDFLHILNQLKKTCTDYEFTDIDVTAHASGFFLDGYETTATVMSFVLYELAANSHVQTKLREELTDNFDDEDKISYEKLQELPYLEAVINETLRLHPPLFVLPKRCTKTYTYVPKRGDGIDKTVVIEEGTPIVIPLSGLHRDPKYFEEPEIFNPERFMGANKEKIVKCTYMPFGEGPRSCLGKRFGLLQSKIGISYVIKNFKLSVNEKTKQPIQYDPLQFITTPKGGLWIDFEPI